MAEQLNFNLGLDATPMIQGATQATQALEQKFKQAGSNIRAELQKPIVVQAEFNLDGDPKKEYDRIVGSQKRVLDEQRKINRKAKEKKTLQDKINQALKGTTAQKRAALKLIDRLTRSTKLTKEEMKQLAQAAKDLKKSLPKDSDMPKVGGGGGMEAGFLKANIAATVLTRTVDMLATGLKNLVTTGMEMQSLNLQMEAFTGSAENAEQAMANFADIASRSPLDVMQVAEAGKIMMAFGVNSRDAAEATEMLAVAAAASGGDINLMSRNLGQIQAQQRAYTRDLTQFAIQGVPIWEELANVTGRSVSELKDMAKDGEIGMQSVMAALRNMTKEGTAFAEVADRMQETYAGKLAKLESNFQTTAGEIIDSIARIDEALGNISGSFGDYLGSLMNQFGEFIDNAATVLEQMKYFEDRKVEEDGFSLGQVLSEYGQTIYDVTYGQLMPANEALAQGVDAVNKAGQNTTAEFSGVKRVADDLKLSVTQLTEKVREYSAMPGNEAFGEQFRATATEAGGLRQELSQLIQAARDQAGVDDARVQLAIEGYKEQRSAAQDALQAIEQSYADKAAAAQDSFEKEKSFDEQFIASKEAVIAKLDEQIAKTRELGPAGQQLEALRRKELEHMAKTGKELEGHITKEQRKKLQAQASLERMDAQARAADLQKQKLEEQERIQKRKEIMEKKEATHKEKMLRIEKEKNTKLEKQNTIIDNLNTSIENLSGVLQGDLVGGWGELEELIGKADTKTGEVDAATKDYNSTINGTIGQLDAVNGRLDTMRKKILSMPKLPKAAPNAFSGGPVSGGDKRTVNELGKEAFLSASGKLSMINAPAWGEWKAPSSGTIIPAHLTKQLDIPTGGINVNRAAGSRASVGGAMSVIQAAGGDTFNNSVTIQAANPVQAANNVMVEMTRLRRRRFR